MLYTIFLGHRMSNRKKYAISKKKYFYTQGFRISEKGMFKSSLKK